MKTASDTYPAIQLSVGHVNATARHIASISPYGLYSSTAAARVNGTSVVRAEELERYRQVRGRRSADPLAVTCL